MTPKIGVILFPGTNCELEALRACERAGMEPQLFRWNEDAKLLKKCDAFILPGGFSYEDRGRSGVIASKENVMEVVKNESLKGKPVLGVCNGAQILVEAGMIPGLEYGETEMGLAWNEFVKNGKLLGVGFYNDWIYIRSDVKAKRSVFNRFSSKVVMRIPVANGEGRFTTDNQKLIRTLIKNEQMVFRYCDEKGKISTDFPINPNGSLYSVAGICNPQGHVMALMPHPERTLSGQPIFDSMADYFKTLPTSIKPSRVTPAQTKKSVDDKREVIFQKPAAKPDILILVELIITDNTERTLENTLKKQGFKDLELQRKMYYGIYSKKKKALKLLAEKIIRSGEILNLHKEIPTIYIGNKVYQYSKENGLQEKTGKNFEGLSFYTAEYDNYFGKNLQQKLLKHFDKSEISTVEQGVFWKVLLKKPEKIKGLIQTHIFHNPHSMKIVQIPMFSDSKFLIHTS